jgi:hypothetical protein
MYEFNSKSNNWRSWRVMAGAYILLPVDKKNKFSINARALGGILNTSNYRFTQSQSVDPADSAGLGPGTVTISSYSSVFEAVKSTFTYSAGIGLRYNIKGEVSLITDLVYYGASTSFQRSRYAGFWGYSTTSGPPANTQGPFAVPKQPMATLNWCIGIGLGM